MKELAAKIWAAEQARVLGALGDNDTAADLAIDFADEDESLMFNSGDLSSSDYGDLHEELHELSALNEEQWEVRVQLSPDELEYLLGSVEEQASGMPSVLESSLRDKLARALAYTKH